MLRLFGYGKDYQLFNKVIAENSTEYLIMNSDISKKYFKSTGFNSDNQSDLFLRNKTNNTFRVFVQGASTVVGYPFYKNASFPRLLKHRLSLTFPNKNIEIINTGITAVNSYTLWDLSDKIIEQKPDLIIIYAGHNEYYGALGVGSTVSIGNHPSVVRSYLKLKNLRFFQLFENGYTKILKSTEKEKYTVKETTLMEVMAKEQQIPINSDVYNAGINQFKSNIKKIITKYQNNNIPVIISTIVSNEKDIKPFISYDFDENEFNNALINNKNEVHKIANQNAKAAYKMGQFYMNQHQDSAKKYFHIAKELDMLRFRAPQKMNDVINELSQQKDIYLVDSRIALLAYSNNGFIDDQLLTEHVHPNVKGNFILADAFYNKIKELQLIGDWGNYISYDNAFKDIPVTLIDSIKGKFIINDLKRSWPYNLKMSGTNPIALYDSIKSLTYEEKKAINLYKGKEEWQAVMREAYHTYKRDGDYKNALKVAQSLIAEFPEQPKVYEMAGDICLEMNNTVYANFYFEKGKKLK